MKHINKSSTRLDAGSPKVAAQSAQKAAAVAAQRDTVWMRKCSAVHVPMACMPRDVAEIIAR